MSGKKCKARLTIKPASKVKIRPLKWFWHGRIPAYMISLIFGLAEAGKSILLSYMAALTSTGGQWPDGSECKQGRVLILSGEEDLARVLVPRLKAMKADLGKIEFVQGVKTGPADNSWFDIRRNLPLLEECLEKRHYELIYIDPVTDYLMPVHGIENLDVRNALGPLEQLAERCKTTFLLITHTRKGIDKTAPALHQAIGSQAYGAIVRSSWLVMRNPEDPEHRMFLRAKLNVGLAKPGLSFRIRQVGGNSSRVRIYWDERPIEKTAEEMLYEYHKRGRKPKRRNEAEEIILQAFKHTDKVKAAKMLLRLKKAGISKKTYTEAKHNLAIKSHPVKSKATDKIIWFWTRKTEMKN